jgi:hypothetical protein
MSIQFLTPIDLTKNEIQNALFHVLGSAPGTPSNGQFYYNSGDHHPYIRSNGAWMDLTNALTLGGVAAASYALLAGPTFTGVPSAPTASPGTNTTQISTTAFVIAEILARLASNDAMLYKGAIDASSNPNYPAADAGFTYRISVAGKIGGASGPNVEIGDMIISHVDGSAAGNHATVGANWDIIQSNVDGAVTLDGVQILTNKTLTTPTIGSFVNATHNHTNAAGGGQLAEGALALTDITTNNVTSTAHGFAPKSPGNAAQFLNGAATPAYAAVKDSDLSISDITTNNVSISAHGFVPKLPNSAAVFLDGTGAFSAPAGASLRFSQDIGDGSTLAYVVTHSLGTRDLTASVRRSTTPWDVVHADVEMTSTTTATIRFAVAPTTNQYRVTFVG